MSIHRETDAELRFHFEARIEELIGQGQPPEAARAQAVAEFGDVDDTRDALRRIDRRVARRRSRGEHLAALWQDLRYTARSLRRSPAVSLTIILTLALGIGVNAAMFSLLDVIYFRPPTGVHDAGALRRVWVERRFADGTQYWPGFDHTAFRAMSGSVGGDVEAMVYRGTSKLKLATGDQAPTIAGSSTSANFFKILGVTPQRGRFFAPGEDTPGAEARVAVISDVAWRARFNGDPEIVGKQITVERVPLTIVGVAPPGFRGVDLDATDLWVPLGALYSGGGTPWWRNANVNGFQVVLRLAPSANEAVLSGRLAGALRGIDDTRFDSGTVVQLGAINRERGPGKVATEMRVATRLAGVAIVVLLIACANVVNLLLARAMTRRREIAVRLALGISRQRLVRLLLIESVLLGLAAGVSALAAAVWAGALVRRLLMPNVVWAADPLHWRMLLFALLASLVAGILTGLVPALQVATPSLTAGLRSGTRDGGLHRSRLRGALVVAQTALSVLLLVGAALFIRSLANVRARDVGYAVDRLAFATASYDTRDSARDAAYSSRLRALESEVAGIGGVRGVAFTSIQPKWGISFAAYFLDADTALHKKPNAFWSSVTPNYFTVAGSRMLRGRGFDAGDGGRAIVINKALADAQWPGEDPIGRCVRLETPSSPCTTIVGVVSTAIETRLDEEPSPHIFLPLDPSPIKTWGASTIVLNVEPAMMESVVARLREVMRRQFPGASIRLQTMNELMAPDYRPWELGARLFTLFGLLALVVTSIGVYSTVAYAVTQRTHEFGVRMALGARAGDVVRQVLGEGLRTIAVGVVIGALLALAGGRIIGALLYGIAPSDPVSLGAVAVVLTCVATLAALRPAWRASRADPVSALRAD